MDPTSVKKAEILGLKLMRASEKIQDDAHALFKKHGLSAPQYNVLRILRGAGPGSLNCHEISHRMIKRVPDITRLLDRLEDKGLVERHRSEEDRRVVMATATPTGLSLLKCIDAPLDVKVARQFGGLPPEDLERLDNLLDALLECLTPEESKRLRPPQNK